MRARGFLEELIRRRAREHPDSVWLKWKDGAVTWAESLSLMQRAANGLVQVGIRPGERVAIMMENRPEFLWAHFGAMLAGAAPFPLNTFQRGPTLEHMLRASEAVAVVCETTLADVVAAARPAAPRLRSIVETVGLVRLLQEADREPVVEAEKPSPFIGMLFTSGTTGPPKAIVAREDAVVGLGDQGPNGILRALPLSSGVQPGETMHTTLPLCHGNSLIVSVAGSILLDAKLALSERFSASRFWRECRETGSVCTSTLGGMVSILLKQPPSPDDRDHGVRVVLSAGCPTDLWEAFERRFGVRLIEYYGQTDSPSLMINVDGPAGSIGRPVPPLVYEVHDGTGSPLGPGEVGEIVCRHPAGPQTYYQDQPEATAAAYADGWWHTGDLGEFDADGNFYYRGRKKESMRRLGRNISAWEIETVVGRHPDVKECAAHAVRSELGEDEVKLVVVLHSERSLEPSALVEYCRERMAYYAVPRYVEFMDAIPKTPITDRFQYELLREWGVTPATWDADAGGGRGRRS